MGLSCGMWDLVPWPGIEPRPAALGVQSLSHWTVREVPQPRFLQCKWHINYAGTVQGVSTLRWVPESEIQMGKPWMGRRFKAIFSKPLWFGNLTRNLLGSRLLMRFLELLGPGVGLEYLGNSRPQGSQGSSFWLGWEVLSCMKSRTLEGVVETFSNLNRNFNCSFWVGVWVWFLLSPNNLFSTDFRFFDLSRKCSSNIMVF